METNEELVHIYYSALNFRDVMAATGRLMLEPPKHRLNLVRTECHMKFSFINTARAGCFIFFIFFSVSNHLTI
jgi:hypothetical protein